MFRPSFPRELRLLQRHARRPPPPPPGLAQHQLLLLWRPLAGSPQHRGKKTQTTVKLSELPQGPVGPRLAPRDDEHRDPVYPTVVLQARRNMQKFHSCVLLTRVGGFYELYFEHAEEYAPLLNLKLASKKTSAGPVPMVCRALARVKPRLR